MSVLSAKKNHIIRNLETQESQINIVFMKCWIVSIAVAVLSIARGTAAAHARGGKDAKDVPPKLRSLRRANVMSGSTAPTAAAAAGPSPRPSGIQWGDQ
jgi:hypothetical protein